MQLKLVPVAILRLKKIIANASMSYPPAIGGGVRHALKYVSYIEHECVKCKILNK